MPSALWYDESVHTLCWSVRTRTTCGSDVVFMENCAAFVNAEKICAAARRARALHSERLLKKRLAL